MAETDGATIHNSRLGRASVKSDVAALLLAAGRSSRMGKFKPLLPFGDQTVVESCLSNLRAAKIEEIILVIGHRADEIRDHLANAEVQFAINPDPDSEMSVSIARGIEHVNLHAEALLIALVDHPAVPAETLRTLIDEWTRTGARLIQPEYHGKGGHPVLVDLSFRDELKQLDSTEGLRGLFRRHRDEARRLTVSSPYVARDMDTWEDYLALHEEFFGYPPRVNSDNFA